MATLNIVPTTIIGAKRIRFDTDGTQITEYADKGIKVNGEIVLSFVRYLHTLVFGLNSQRTLYVPIISDRPTAYTTFEECCAAAAEFYAPWDGDVVKAGSCGYNRFFTASMNTTTYISGTGISTVWPTAISILKFTKTGFSLAYTANVSGTNRSYIDNNGINSGSSHLGGSSYLREPVITSCSSPGSSTISVTVRNLDSAPVYLHVYDAKDLTNYKSSDGTVPGGGTVTLTLGSLWSNTTYDIIADASAQIKQSSRPSAVMQCKTQEPSST